MKRKIFVLLISILLSLLLTGAAAFAQVEVNESASGTVGDNLTWSYEDGTLTISGTGEMDSYENESSYPWYTAYSSKIKTVIIEDGVTSIGKSAFESCACTEKIVFPQSVETIGAMAFTGSSFSSITIADGVTSIGSSAFYNSATAEVYTFEGCTAYEYFNKASNFINSNPPSVKILYEETEEEYLNFATDSINVNWKSVVDLNNLLAVSENLEQSLTLTSSNENAVGINEDNRITAYSTAPNSATVTATASYGDKEYEAVLTVNIVSGDPGVPTALTLNKTETTLNKTEKEMLTCTVNPADSVLYKDVSWKSSNKSVATVSNGMIEAKETGKATITATYTTTDDQKISATCAVTVENKARKILVLPDESFYIINKGETRQLPCYVYPSDATDRTQLEFSSTSEKLQVQKNGTVKALGADGENKQIVKAQIGTGEDAVFEEIPVLVLAKLKSISLDKTEIEWLFTDSSTDLTVIFDPEDTTDSREVTWKSSKPSIATVTPAEDTSKATVTALTRGTVTITATCGSAEATCDVTCAKYVAMTGITMKAGTSEAAAVTEELTYGESAKLLVNYDPKEASGSATEWTSKYADGTDASAAVEVVPTKYDNQKEATIKVKKYVDKAVIITAKVIDKDPDKASSEWKSYTATCTVTTKKKDISDESITIDTIADKTYTGSEIKPEPVVKDGDTTLKEGEDYTLSYSDNIVAASGSAETKAPTVTITGIGNYNGTNSTTFTIKPKTIKDVKITGVESKTYTGSEITFDLTVKDMDRGEDQSGEKLVEDKDYTVSYSNNTDAADEDAETKAPTVTITGKGNYSTTTSASVKFTISPKEIAESMVADIDPLTYTGSALTPDLTVKYDSITLEKGTLESSGDPKDYTVEYSNNTDATTDESKAKATVTGHGNYTGSAEKTFVISQKAIDATMIDDIVAQTYSGSALTPDVTVKYGDITLAKGTLADPKDPKDYTVAYTNNTDAALSTAGDKAPTATITGHGNYSGTVDKAFTINPKSLSDSMIAEIPNQEYALGEAVEPTLTVKDGKITLVKGTKEEPKDYTVEYTNNKAIAGEDATDKPTATITGQGNYTGTASRTFVISKVGIKKDMITAIDDQDYTGAEITPTVVVTYKGKELTQGTEEEPKDYSVEYKDNINAGKATVTVTGTSDTYGGEVEINFNINPIKPADVAIADITDQTYTGKAIEPELTVTAGGKTLVAGTDYTAEYTNKTDAASKEAGAKAPSVTITGKGNYSSSMTASKTFTISPKEITADMVGTIGEQTYTGSALTPDVTVKYGNITLAKGTLEKPKDLKDYTVEYSDNTNAALSTAESNAPTVKISGHGNYSGTVNKTFTILPKKITADMIGTIDDQTYNGDALTPEVTVKDGETPLVQGTAEDPKDYIIEYSNNTNAAGKDAGNKAPTVTITGQGNYGDSASKTFTIKPKSMEGVTIATIDPVEYTGSEIKPSIKVTDKKTDGTEIELKENVDFAVACTNNINVAESTAAKPPTVTITGKGNYDSSTKRTAKFTISKKAITESMIQPIADQIYTGRAIEPAVTVKHGSITLKQGAKADYTVKYENNTDVSTGVSRAKATVTGCGNYDGSADKVFYILKTVDISRASVGLSGYSFTYTGGAISPGVTITYEGKTYSSNVSYGNNVNIGTAVANVTSDSFNGTATLYYTINPQPTKIKKPSKGSKKLTAKWSKVSKKKKKLVTGYQVICSPDPNFGWGVKYKSVKGWNKSSVTIKGLAKKKTYYVKVRTYKKAGGTYYSDWSAVKAVKTK